MTYYGGRGGAEYRPLFTRSLDGGLTWLGEALELDQAPLPRTRIGFHQIETNTAGRVSATWSIEWREEQYWRVRELRHRRSPDAGESWTGQVFRWPFLNQTNYPQPVTGPDGELYVLFTEGATDRSVLRFIRTADMEVSQAQAPVTLPGSDSVSRQQQGKPLFRAAHWPVLTIEPLGAIYAIWQETTPQGNEILFSRSQDEGKTWLTPSIRLNRESPLKNYTGRIPVVALDKQGGIYAVWEDLRHSTSDLYFNRSLDGGATWLDQDIWLTAVRPTSAAASSPILSTDRSGNLYLLWSDIREGPNTLYFTRSLDRGTTWLTQPIRVDRHGPDELTYAHRLAHDDTGHVYVTWWQGKDAKKGSIRLNLSDDHGATWLEKELVLDSGTGNDGPRFPW
ncbi:MAG: sialidase family protein, partial [Candidatus Methylomirabilis sp.]